jgi:hypothetical protein
MTHVVVWPYQQAGPLSRQKLLYGFDFFRSIFLL